MMPWLGLLVESKHTCPLWYWVCGGAFKVYF